MRKSGYRKASDKSEALWKPVHSIIPKILKSEPKTIEGAAIMLAAYRAAAYIYGSDCDRERDQVIFAIHRGAKRRVPKLPHD